ncbi:MAG: hypothetical protein ACI971_002549, partial [Colwellia sp.]
MKYVLLQASLVRIHLHLFQHIDTITPHKVGMSVGIKNNWVYCGTAI